MVKPSSDSGYTLVELLIVTAIVGMVAAGIVGVYQVSQGIYTRATGLEDAQSGARAGLDRMASELRLIGSYWFGAATSAQGNAIIAATPTSITFMANVDNVDALSVINGAEATPSSTATGTSVPLSLSAADTADAFRIYVANPETNNDYIYIANGGGREVRRITGIDDGNTLTLTPALSSSYPVGSIVRDVKRITYARDTVANRLTRTQGGSGADPVVDNVTGLTFTYYGTTGCTDPGCTGCTGTGATGGGALASTPPDPGLIGEIRIELTVQGTVQGPERNSRCMTTRVRPRNLLP